MDIDGRVMIVTGASSGIGAATARAAARQGARLVLAARNRERLDTLAAGMQDAAVVPTDMRDPADIRRMVDVALDRWGGVDILVNNAGQGLHVPLEQIRLEDLVAVVELNVYGALLAMQAVIPGMRDRGAGAIVNVSSGTTRMAAPVGTSGYSATKAALNVLSRTARAELAGDGIAVSTVYPFITATEFHETLRAGSLRVGGPRFEPDPPERVADVILDLVRSGEEEAVMVPAGLVGGA